MIKDMFKNDENIAKYSNLRGFFKPVLKKKTKKQKNNN